MYKYLFLQKPADRSTVLLLSAKINRENKKIALYECNYQKEITFEGRKRI